jgi:hypothetical protein
MPIARTCFATHSPRFHRGVNSACTGADTQMETHMQNTTKISVSSKGSRTVLSHETSTPADATTGSTLPQSARRHRGEPRDDAGTAPPPRRHLQEKVRTHAYIDPAPRTTHTHLRTVARNCPPTHTQTLTQSYYKRERGPTRCLLKNLGKWSKVTSTVRPVSQLTNDRPL